MGAFGQVVPYQLPSQTYAASGVATQPLRDLPKTMFGKLTHLHGIQYDVAFTPTWTTAGPDLVGNNNFLTQCDFYDGSTIRFQGGFNHLRAAERLESGKTRNPDADTDTASATARYFRRVMHTGPIQFSNAPSDFVIPCGALENGELRFSFGSLANLAGNGGGSVSAATGTLKVTAQLILLDEIRIPPCYTFTNYAANAQDFLMPGRALYAALALLNSSSFDAITAGDFGNIRLDMGQGDIIPSIPAQVLTAMAVDMFGAGEFSGFAGEPLAASDDNMKSVNHASPTAITAQPADLQPVLVSPPASRLTKLFLADSAARLRWDGSQTSAVVLAARILAQPPNVIGAMVGKALGRLNVKASTATIKSESGKGFLGSYQEFMPWKVSVAK
jgi:hypothetical protein